jgi:hypothetical protein
MKKQTSWRIFFFCMLLGVIFTSCKKENDENEETHEAPVQLKKVLDNEFILYNQFSPDSEGSFYNVQEQLVTNDVNADFDFAFAYYTATNSSLHKYIIASPSSEELQLECKLIDKEYTSEQKTVFYKLPGNFSYSKFDTLKTVAGLNKVLEGSQKIYNKDNSTDCIYSDQFGWSRGQLFGFKLSSGKYGIMKIIGLSEYIANETGNIYLHVKYESE